MDGAHRSVQALLALCTRLILPSHRSNPLKPLWMWMVFETQNSHSPEFSFVHRYVSNTISYLPSDHYGVLGRPKIKPISYVPSHQSNRQTLSRPPSTLPFITGPLRRAQNICRITTRPPLPHNLPPRTDRR